jgi:hypothetical protein
MLSSNQNLQASQNFLKETFKKMTSSPLSLDKKPMIFKENFRMLKDFGPILVLTGFWKLGGDPQLTSPGK